jgi:hypothetical protein
MHQVRRPPRGRRFDRARATVIPSACCRRALARGVLVGRLALMTDREAKTRAVKILAKSIYRDLEAQGFDEKQIVALATELISEVTTKISRTNEKTQTHQVA